MFVDAPYLDDLDASSKRAPQILQLQNPAESEEGESEYEVEELQHFVRTNLAKLEGFVGEIQLLSRFGKNIFHSVPDHMLDRPHTPERLQGTLIKSFFLPGYV